MSGEASEVDFSFEVTKGVAAQFSMAAIGFVGTIVFARLLGPNAFGGYYLLLALVQIASKAAAGWGVGVKKRLSESDAEVGPLVGSVLVVWLALVVGFGVAVVLAWDRLVAFTGVPNAPVLFVVLLAPITLFVQLEHALDASGRVGTVRWIDALRSFLTFPFQLGLVMLNLGAAGMAFGLGGATIATVPLVAYLLRAAPGVPSRSDLRSVWKFARYSIPSRFTGIAYQRYDTLLIGLVLTPSVAGHYEVAWKLTVPATFVTVVAGSGLMVRVSNLRSKGGDVGVDVTNTLAFTSIAAVPLLFGALAMPRGIVVTAYGAEYADAAPLLVGIALYQLVRTHSDVFVQTISGLDRPDIVMKLKVGTLLFNVVLGYLLVVRVGAIGVVAATVVAEALRYLVGAVFVRRAVDGVRLLPRLFYEQVAAGLVMFGVVVALHQVVPIRSWLHLGVRVGVGSVIYGTLLVAISEQVRFTVDSVLSATVGSDYRPW